MMIATYSLLTIRPDPERLDEVCVGALIRDHAAHWHVVAPPSADSKLVALGAPPGRLASLADRLTPFIAECADLSEARVVLGRVAGSLCLHQFEGMFAYQDAGGFRQHLEAIVGEAVSIQPQATVASPAPVPRRVRPHTRARLRSQFKTMGIMADSTAEIGEHKVVSNFPVSTEHGLTAEFALQNSVMHITETVDFEVSEQSTRIKKFEAQAKCLVLKAALERFGAGTECYVVLSGGGAPQAARTVDLLSTVARLYALESAADMAAYFDRIGSAAGISGQLQ